MVPCCTHHKRGHDGDVKNDQSNRSSSNVGLGLFSLCILATIITSLVVVPMPLSQGVDSFRQQRNTNPVTFYQSSSPRPPPHLTTTNTPTTSPVVESKTPFTSTSSDSHRNNFIVETIIITILGGTLIATAAFHNKLGEQRRQIKPTNSSRRYRETGASYVNMTLLLALLVLSSTLSSFLSLPANNNTNNFSSSSFVSFAEAATATLEHTESKPLGALPNQNGLGNAGWVDMDSIHPLTGASFVETHYSSWPTSYTSGGSPVGCALMVENYLWMLPADADRIARMNRYSGLMDGFTFPTVNGATTYKYVSAAFDPIHRKIWMAPYSVDHVVSINVDTLLVEEWNNFPGSFTPGIAHYVGTIAERNNIWMAPLQEGHVLRINTANGNDMSAFSSWPGTINLGTYSFNGAVFDGEDNGGLWLCPYDADEVVRFDVFTGNMNGYWTGLPTSPSGGRTGGGTFDGTYIWMPPREAPYHIRIHHSTGAITAYYTWPGGSFSLNTHSFNNALFDGLYIWYTPLSATHIVRFEPSNPTAITAFNDVQAFLPLGSYSHTQGSFIDFATRSLYMAPLDSTLPVVRLQWFDTPTATETEPTDSELSPTRTATITTMPTATVSGATETHTEETLSLQTPSSSQETVTVGTDTKQLGAGAGSATVLQGAGGSSASLLPTPTQHPTHSILQGLTATAAWSASHPQTQTLSGLQIMDGRCNSGSTSTIRPIAEGLSTSQTVQITALPQSWFPFTFLQGSSFASSATFPSGASFVPFLSGVSFDDQHIWWIPFSSNEIVRMHKNSNGHQMVTAFNSWSSIGPGFSLGPGAFVGAGYDSSAQKIWMTPGTATHVVQYDTNTGTATGFNSFPAGISSLGTSGNGFQRAFSGGFVAHGFFWMAPYQSNTAVRVETSTGVMSDYISHGGGTWPIGCSPVTSNINYATVLYDGDANAFLVPNERDRIVAVRNLGGATAPYSITGLSSWPTGITFGAGGRNKFGGGTVDGQRVMWLVPLEGNMVVSVNTLTGTMSGAVLTSPDSTAGTQRYETASFDSRYVWCVPRSALSILRFDTFVGSEAFSAPMLEIPIWSPIGSAGAGAWEGPSGFVMDFSTNSFLMVPWQYHQGGGATSSSSSGRIVKMTFATSTVTPQAISATLNPDPVPGGPSPPSSVSSSSTSSDSPNQSASSASGIQTTGGSEDLRSTSSSAASFNPNGSRSEEGSSFSSGQVTSGFGQLTTAPQSPAALVRSSIFGFEAEEVPCVDPVILSWILFLFVLIVMIGVSLIWHRKQFALPSETRDSTAAIKKKGAYEFEMKRMTSKSTIEASDLVLAVQRETVEINRRAWMQDCGESSTSAETSPKKIIFRSFLLEHHWMALFVPCHDQCASRHVVSCYSHFLTLLWIAAAVCAIGKHNVDKDLPATVVWMAAIFASLLAAAIRPLLHLLYKRYSMDTIQSEKALNNHSIEGLSKSCRSLGSRRGSTSSLGPASFRGLSQANSLHAHTPRGSIAALGEVQLEAFDFEAKDVLDVEDDVVFTTDEIAEQTNNSNNTLERHAASGTQKSVDLEASLTLGSAGEGTLEGTSKVNKVSGHTQNEESPVSKVSKPELPTKTDVPVSPKTSHQPLPVRVKVTGKPTDSASLTTPLGGNDSQFRLNKEGLRQALAKSNASSHEDDDDDESDGEEELSSADALPPQDCGGPEAPAPGSDDSDLDLEVEDLEITIDANDVKNLTKQPSMRKISTLAHLKREDQGAPPRASSQQPTPLSPSLDPATAPVAPTTTLVETIIISTQRERRIADIVHGIYIISATVLIVILGASKLQGPAVCGTYTNEVIPLTILLDFLVFQPLGAIGVLMYRYGTSGKEELHLECRLHPRDCSIEEDSSFL